jgi:hypothetical protein
MAYEITWEDVENTARAIKDDLGEFNAAEQKLILDMAHRRVSEAKFLEETFDGRRYYAAHMAAMADNEPAGEGTRSSESIGSVSTGVTLAVNNPTAKENLLSTVYGREFHLIRESVYPAFFVV